MLKLFSWQIFSLHICKGKNLNKSTLPHLYDSDGHDHTFKDNFKVANVFESLNRCLDNLNVQV